MVRLLAERSDVNSKSNVNLGGFRSQLRASYVSSHTEELWFNEAVCLWMTIYIYIYVCVCVCVCVWFDSCRSFKNVSSNNKDKFCLYNLFTPEAPLWRYLSVWESIWGHIYVPIDENQTSSPHHGVWGCHFRWRRYASIHFPTWH